MSVDSSASSPNIRMEEVSLGSKAKVTIERRGQVVLIGINRPYIQNRIDPETFQALAKAYYDYDQDQSLRSAVLFGHGPNFSRGIDVDGFKTLVSSGKPLLGSTGVIDPLAKAARQRSKPVVVVVHGDTWNMGHEIHLAADVRVASADTNYGQDENIHGRFPGGGGTVRFVREAGWGNAMRYMLTGDHWSAEEAYRMGLVQQVSPNPASALEAGVSIASKIAACGPLSIKTTLASAHMVIDPIEHEALSQLEQQYSFLYRTKDFVEGRSAEAEKRPPIYEGK
jgi:enoyl-CoA hydratase